MLAQMSAVDPYTFYQVITIVLVLVGALCAVKAAFFPARSVATPQPLRVTSEPQLVTETEWKLTTQSLSDRVMKLEVQLAEIRQESRADREAIRQAIHDVERRLVASGQEAERNTHARINELMKLLAERLPAPVA